MTSTDLDLNKWRVVITATQEADFIWLEEGEEPTIGPAGEPIDTEKSRIVQTILQNTVKIQQETTPTGGHFKMVTLAFDAPANSQTVFTHTWPFQSMSLAELYIQLLIWTVIS